MIKINKISEENKNIFLADIKKRYLDSLEKIKTNAKYDKLFQYLKDGKGEISAEKLNKILIGDINDLTDVISSVGVISENRTENFHNLYNNFSSRALARKWGEQIGVKVCPYCNRSFIFTLKRGIRPQYDHFFPKSKYSYLSVSMYNLIPCCPICNLSKQAHDPMAEPMIYPFEDEFGYDIYFQIDTEDIYTYIGLSDNFNFFINYNEKLINNTMIAKVKKSNEILKLTDLYNKHKDYAKMILKSKYIYTDDYCESLLKSYPLLFTNIDDVKNNVYLNYLEKESWGNQVLAKLTYDLLHMEG